MCYYVKFDTTVITGERNPKIGDRWDLALLGSGVADPLITLLVCYHVRFDKREPPKLGNEVAPPLAVKASLTHRNMLLPKCYPADFGRR